MSDRASRASLRRVTATRFFFGAAFVALAACGSAPASTAPAKAALPASADPWQAASANTSASTPAAATAAKRDAVTTSAPAPAITLTPAETNAAALPLDATLPLRADMQRFTLNNGLTVYVMAHAKPQKRAQLWLAVNAGSMLEDDDQQGLAHFVEHMAFNGTKRFPKNAIVDFIEKSGMKFGADANAYTSFDQTVYQLTVPTDDAKLLSTGLAVLRDWAGNLTFDPAEVEKERGVVLEEWRLGRNAMGRITDALLEAALPGTRYAKRLPIGKPEILKTAPVAALQRFYQDWYRPEHMAVIVVGDFDATQMAAEVKQVFGDLPTSQGSRARLVGGQPPANGPRVFTAQDKEMPLSLVMIDHQLPRSSEHRVGDFRQFVVRNILDAMISRRLEALARRPSAPFVNGDASFSSMVRESEAFSVVAMAKPGQGTVALRVLLTELQRIAQHGFTPSEFERTVAAQLRASEQSARNTTTEPSRALADETTRNFFENEMMSGRSVEYALQQRFAKDITLADVQSEFARWYQPAHRVFALIGPTGKPLPTQAEVLAADSAARSTKLAPWDDTPVTTPLFAEAAALAPGRIVAEAKLSAIGAEKWTLANGATVIIKPTTFDKDTVHLRAVSPGGYAMASSADFAAVRRSEDVVTWGGVGKHDPMTLDKILMNKVVQLDSYIGQFSEGFYGSAAPADFESALALLHLQMTAPRRDDGMFAEAMRNEKDALIESERMPEGKFSRGYRERVALSTRAQPLAATHIAKLDYTKSLQFYKQQFGNAADFTFIIVGAVDPKTARPLVEKYLGSLPSLLDRKDAPADTNDRKWRGGTQLWRAGTEPKATVAMRFVSEAAWSQQDEDDLGVLSDVLDIRLREVLREDKGGVYGVMAQGKLARAPQHVATFDIQFGCDPKRRDELKKAVQTTLAEIAKNGVSEDILTKLRTTYERERETALTDNKEWAQWLSEASLYHDDYAAFLDIKGKLARVNNDVVRAAAQRFLPAKSLFVGELAPVK